MDSRFAIVERTYYWKDRFDTPLDSYLFDSIEHLRVISSGDHPIWRIVVADLLSTYYMRIFMSRIYHFKLSFGFPHKDKNKRQIDFEKHISMLEFTDARKHISEVCIESLSGHAWQAIQKLRKMPWQSLFKPKLIFWRLLSMPMELLLTLGSRGSGAMFALEIFGLLKSLDDNEFKAILGYLEKPQKEDEDGWRVLYFLNILTRPGMISEDMKTHLEAFVFSREFRRDAVQQQVLARLAKISPLALQKLEELSSKDEDQYSGRLNSDALDILVEAAATRPEVMEFWLRQSSQLNRYFYSGVDDTFRKKLGSVDVNSLDVVFEFARNGNDVQSKFAESILNNIQHATNAAQRYLYNRLRAGNQNEIFLTASVINNLQVADRLMTEEVFDALLDIALGPAQMETTDKNHQVRDEFQKKVLELLLEICKDRQDLVRKLLVALRDRWANEFIEVVTQVFANLPLSHDLLVTFANYLRTGDLESCNLILNENKQIIGLSKYVEVLEALETIKNNDMLDHVFYDNGTDSQQEFSKICHGYLSRVWRCLTVISSKVSSLSSSDSLILTSLLCLTKSNRYLSKAIPVSKYDDDSYIAVCTDIGRAIDVISSFENDELVVNTLINYSKSSDCNIDLLMRAISYFSAADQRLIEIVREGFTERYTGREGRFPWQNMNRLSSEGVSLVLKSILNRSATTEILKNPHTVDAAGAEILIDALKRRKELVHDDINELWLFIYAIKSLVHSSMINEDVINICKDILSPKVSMFNDSHALDERPYAAWTLSRVRPFRTDIYYFLKELVTSGPTQFTAYGHAVWTKVAAMIAISESGSDITNQLSWAEREDIADVIIKYVTLPFQTDFNLFGGENVFPEKPSDAVYDAACLIVETMRKHWAQTDYVVKDIID
ncbi:MAG: hypothetical protein HND47_14160 [Chloroflexi bacterium]|nr:hypothetical protein [Chloroflexota bacterium]